MLAPHQRVGHVTRVTLPGINNMIQCPQRQSMVRLLPVAGIASRLNHHWHAGQFRRHRPVESAVDKECLQYVRPESANRASEIEKHARAGAFSIFRWTDQNHRTIHSFFLQTFRWLQNKYHWLKVPRINAIKDLHYLLFGSAGMPILNNVNDEGQPQASGSSR